MPSISQARLDELNAAVANATKNYQAEVKRAEQAEARVKKFDVILDKIGRAANGQPLTDERNRGGAFSYANHGSYLTSDGHQCQPPPVEEVQRRQIDALNERIVGLESRLAAVVAVSTFAKEHKW